MPSSDSSPLIRFSNGYTYGMRIALEVALLVVTVAGTVALLALMLWGAREDGRDQQRRDRRLR